MALDDKTVKIVLDKRDPPTRWYNVVPDLPAEITWVVAFLESDDAAS